MTSSFTHDADTPAAPSQSPSTEELTNALVAAFAQSAPSPRRSSVDPRKRFERELAKLQKAAKSEED